MQRAHAVAILEHGERAVAAPAVGVQLRAGRPVGEQHALANRLDEGMGHGASCQRSAQRLRRAAGVCARLGLN